MKFYAKLILFFDNTAYLSVTRKISFFFDSCHIKNDNLINVYDLSSTHFLGFGSVILALDTTGGVCDLNITWESCVGACDDFGDNFALLSF